jgi:PAS domain S-box-containing protein/putative nucleotidyltransferase with HDIG domain
MKRLIRYSVFRIVLLYLVIGSLWIALSDRIVEMLVSDPHKLTVLQTYKGWVFVAASAVLLGLVVRREFLNRERAESALCDTEQKYRMLMQRANDGIVIADAATGVILEVNQKIEDLTGQQADRLIGRHVADLHPLKDSDGCRKLLQETLGAGNAMAGDLCIMHRDGRNIPVEVSVSVVTVGGKKIVQGIFRDVSRRVAAEEAHRKEKERAEKYLEVAGVMIRVLDRSGAVILINKKGSEILGYPEEEIVGKNWVEHFVPERLRGEIRAVLAKLISGELELVEYYENPVVTKSGQERIIAWYNTLLRDDQGLVFATLSSGEDITARKKAEEQAQSRLDHLAALHAIDMIISSSLNLSVTLQELLTFVTTRLHVDAAAILLLNPYTQMLEYAAMQGFRNEAIRHSRLRLGEGVAGRAALERRSIGIPDLRENESEFKRMPLIEGEGFVAYYAVPLIVKGQVKGVLDVLHRAHLDIDEEWTSFFNSLAAQAAIAIDNAALFSDLQRSNAELILAYDTTIEGWARALELRDQETEGHTKRVVEITLRLARAMGMDEAALVHVRRGALLHDIGKMSIQDDILLKAGPLTEEEWQVMRHHPVAAFEMLFPISYLRPALDIPYCHHERWDGTGYPRGLKGEQIPLAARIFSLADIWDALNSKRRYHSAWPEEQVREHIRSLAGTQFDPKVVELFLSLEPTLREEVGGVNPHVSQT